MIKNIKDVPITLRNTEARIVICNFQEIVDEGLHNYNNDIICSKKHYDGDGSLCDGEDCILQKNQTILKQIISKLDNMGLIAQANNLVERVENMK